MGKERKLVQISLFDLINLSIKQFSKFTNHLRVFGSTAKPAGHLFFFFEKKNFTIDKRLISFRFLISLKSSINYLSNRG